jgi:hypothetical protein
MAAFTSGSSTPCSALKTIEAESPPAPGNSVARSSRPALLSEAGAVMLDVNAGPMVSTADHEEGGRPQPGGDVSPGVRRGEMAESGEHEFGSSLS